MIDAGYLFLYENKEWKKKLRSPPKKIEKRTKKNEPDRKGAVSEVVGLSDVIRHYIAMSWQKTSDFFFHGCFHP